jgi:hypothetical protein
MSVTIRQLGIVREEGVGSGAGVDVTEVVHLLIARPGRYFAVPHVVPVLVPATSESNLPDAHPAEAHAD